MRTAPRTTSRSSLVELAKGARIQGWWRSLADPVPESMNLMLTLEDEVVSEDHYACMYVPGLLQTRAYAEAVHRASEIRCTDKEIQHMVDIRMKRQELLDRYEPPHIWAVVDEAVIRRAVGGRDTMRAQLRHLLEQARRPHVTVQSALRDGRSRGGRRGPQAPVYPSPTRPGPSSSPAWGCGGCSSASGRADPRIPKESPAEPGRSRVAPRRRTRRTRAGIPRPVGTG
ncbi:hypothetical protein SGR_4665 [Streptomyces griseus subsp. griseus NBRC 13350]|uniref:DUF5753 domain-containing protein n=1 Tax=Streptomyces griseus subsp. griseus (strain JCM 4626 / CBS 651.72 / NBRC 13350 / KCC S-0626 / ISP 5235) TaxID=455632 RepID=B1VVY3_STRGG|nr:hypothetical protein SGR_4665 [Streptomyces griseus subsp. griseus NBRC 13350]